MNVSGFADFFDGRVAVVRRVAYVIDCDAGRLTVDVPEAVPITWLFADLRAVRDQATAGTLIVTTAQHPLARLILTDEAAVAVLQDNASALGKPQPMRGRARVAGWAAAAVASVLLIVFLLVPLLADQLARALPSRGEIALGDATFDQIRAALSDGMSDAVPVCDDPGGRAAMAKMQATLTRGGLDLPYNLEVTILDHPMVNAFALPGGRVVFFRGMLEAATHPDQIAAVLAHEIGHVAARDPTRIALRSTGSLGVLGLLLGDFAGGAAVLFLVEQLIRADYTQEAEAAADDFGIDMMTNAGADPGALADLFEILKDQYGDVQGIARHFVSHPTLGDRIGKARVAGAELVQTSPILDDAAWAALQGICDPR